ncbi:hypothetical protein EV182_001454 [Spiromyces aspiralis]|uniref:Uncharacterized protein n=1 Tax=Spiromyces aspiralis TaxID=68401 RepID=A0ACC1HFK6_9FUNG|nr:hypothetical protein EV182_001454 [Spiromyces aspiralis]
MDRSSPGKFNDRILNFRDIGKSFYRLRCICRIGESAGSGRSDRKMAETTDLLAPCLLFRSAELTHANTDDIQELFNTYGIHTIIDLRSELETEATGELAHCYPAASILNFDPSDLMFSEGLFSNRSSVDIDSEAAAIARASSSEGRRSKAGSTKKRRFRHARKEGQWAGHDSGHTAGDARSISSSSEGGNMAAATPVPPIAATAATTSSGSDSTTTPTSSLLLSSSDSSDISDEEDSGSISVLELPSDLSDLETTKPLGGAGNKGERGMEVGPKLARMLQQRLSVDQSVYGGRARDEWLPKDAHHSMHQGRWHHRTRRRRFRINLIGSKYRWHGVWSECPLHLKMRALYTMAIHGKREASYLIAQNVVGPRGLLRLYQDIIDYSQDELRQVMMIFSHPRRYPILVHCTHGKDRTGIVVALVSSLAGISDELIALDYSLSQLNLLPIRERMEKVDMGASGLPSEFCDSPASVMMGLLDYIGQRYGGVRQYLLGIGMTDKQLDTIVMCLRGVHPQLPTVAYSEAPQGTCAHAQSTSMDDEADEE